MDKLGRKIWYIMVLSVFGLLLSVPQGVQAEAKKSGRMYQFIYGHANGHDLEFGLTIEKGETRSEYMIPQFRWLRGVDGYSIFSLFTKDEFVDKYNKDFVKEKKGYSMEAVAGDSTIVQIINNGRGSYSVKGLKEGQTVIRFYETLGGVKRYLGCRLVIVGQGDCLEETVTIFLGSWIPIPSNWTSVPGRAYGIEGTDETIVPKDKSLFKKVKVSSDFSYYQAIKTGETTATMTINKQKKSFKVKIIEPAVSKNAKKEYTLYEGYRVGLESNYGYFDDLFDHSLESTLIKGVSKDPKIADIGYKDGYPYIEAKKSGKTAIDLYYKLNGKSIHLGQVVIKVLKSNATDYISRLAVAKPDETEMNTVTKGNKTIDDEMEDDITEDDYIDIVEGMRFKLRSGDNYQFHITSSRDFDIKWSVSDEKIAKIDPDTGLFTALKTGTVVVKAFTSKLFSSCFITIVEKDAIIINGFEVITGERFMVYTADYDNVTWNISDPSKAILQVEGNKVTLYPIDVGTVILSAQSGSNRGQIEITIEDVGVDYYYNYYSELIDYDSYEYDESETYYYDDYEY